MSFPAWLCPTRPPELPESSYRQIKMLDPLPPGDVPNGLAVYRRSKRKEHLSRIAAMGITEKEYILRQKAVAARKRRGKFKKLTRAELGR